jgi:hypothetical protein
MKDLQGLIRVGISNNQGERLNIYILKYTRTGDGVGKMEPANQKIARLQALQQPIESALSSHFLK